MKASVKTSIVALAIAGLVAVFAGTAMAAPAGPQGSALSDMFQPSSAAATGPGVAIAPELVLECIVCPELELAPVDPQPAAGDDSPTPTQIPEDQQEIPQDTPDTPDKPEVPETPATPETPDTPEVTDTPEAPSASTEPPATSSKLPNTGTKLMLMAVAAVAMIGGAPLVGMWADSRQGKK